MTTWEYGKEGEDERGSRTFLKIHLRNTYTELKLKLSKYAEMLREMRLFVEWFDLLCQYLIDCPHFRNGNW